MAKISISTNSILRISIPLIINQLSMQLQIFADRAMLGHVSPEYFSAVGNVLTPYSAATAIIFAFCTGTTILVAQSVGAKSEACWQSYAECSFVGNSLISLLFFVLFFFASGFMFTLMGVQSPILEYSKSFLRILSFNLLIYGFVSTSVSVMQGIGKTKIIMISGLISNVLNILLDWVLIFGKFGIPRMNIEGAALATCLSNFLAAPIIVIYLFVSKKNPLKLSIKNLFRFRWNMYKKIIRLGAPSGAEIALFHIGNLVVISFLNRLNIMATGIYTLILSLELFPWLIYMGFANAALTLVGQKVGGDAHEQAIRVGFKCMRFSLLVCAAVAVLFIALPTEVISIFTNDQSLVKYSEPFLIFASVTMFPRSVNNVFGSAIKGMGDTLWMLYSQIGGTILVIALAYILIFQARLGLWGLFIAFLADETVRGVINFLRFWKGREIFHLRPLEKAIVNAEGSFVIMLKVQQNLQQIKRLLIK